MPDSAEVTGKIDTFMASRKEEKNALYTKRAMVRNLNNVVGRKAATAATHADHLGEGGEGRIVDLISCPN